MHVIEFTDQVDLLGDAMGWPITDVSAGPRLGLLCVVRPHRRTLLASALLRMGLEKAATWGHESFSTMTSPSNRTTYPAVARLGVEPIGRSLQMMRPAS